MYATKSLLLKVYHEKMERDAASGIKENIMHKPPCLRSWMIG